MFRRNISCVPIRIFNGFTLGRQNIRQFTPSRALQCSTVTDDGKEELSNVNQNEELDRLKSRTSTENELHCQYEDISRAYYRIRGGIKRTHCDYSPPLSELSGTKLYMKKEFLQVTGSFKERGARNALMMLNEEQKSIGVVAASAGNHALALAYHGNKLGIPVTCVMPTNAPFTKVDKAKKLGANVVLHGAHIGESKAHATSEFKNLKYINGYDDAEIVAGAGTVAVEILEQVPDVDAIVCPVGGCGLIAGVSQAMKTLRPECAVIGVEPENVASFTAALDAGQPVETFKGPTLADGLAVPLVGANAFNVARKYVDSTVLVNERRIAIGILRLLELEKCVVEGGGGTAVASLLPGGPLYGKFEGKKVVAILSGGNIDTTMLGRVIERGLAVDERLVRFVVTVSDRPGGIARLSKAFLDAGVSIKDIYHERAWLHTQMDLVNVMCIVETTGKEHTEMLFAHLAAEGHHVMREGETDQLNSLGVTTSHT